MMTDEITKKCPQDVVIHLILRFPVKFLLRFRCVSKIFYTLIQSSIFTNLYLNHTTTTTYDSILLKRSFKEDIERYKAIFSILSSDGDDYLKVIYPDLDVPYRIGSYSITNDKLIGPSHGLIALMNSRTAILINPSTRKCRLLPSSPFDIPKGVYRSIRSGGFGFDSVVNDFKVFRIYEDYKEDRYGYPEKGETKVEVYELGIDIWRELDHVDQEMPLLFWSTSLLFYKGAFHWITSSENDEQVILCFDISTEIFRNVKIPDTREFSNGTHRSLLHMNQSLCLTCYPVLGPIIDPTKDFMEIWIMKDYNIYESWFRKYTIRGIPTELPLVVWKDYLLVFQCKSGYLMSYDLNSEDIKELNIHGCAKSMRVIIYKESLTPIPRGGQNSTRVQNV